jgi:hypothetical protein
MVEGVPAQVPGKVLRRKMPRIRYLKPEFFSDEDLSELPFETRLTFAGLWCFADKAGRLEDRPKFLKAMIFPYDKVDIEKQLSSLSNGKHENGIPFIHRYEIEGKRFIQILTWEKHQKPHHTEAESKIPPAPPLMEKGIGMDIVSSKGCSFKEPCNNGEVTVKEKYGEFNNVFLTEYEYHKLLNQFGETGTKEKIQSLSEYIASKNKKYSSHYATILAWERKNKPVKSKEKSW